MEKYTVVVADDEPMAVQAICKIIEKHCPQFAVVGTGTNGEDTLKVIQQTEPDLVITDIDMPMMNGLTLAQEVHKTIPDTMFVIISGYQTFDYMQTAIREGVLDYLPKPIVPSKVIPTMENVAERIRTLHASRRVQVLKDLCGNVPVDEKRLKKSLTSDHYFIGLIRFNGLPRRFGREEGQEIVGVENFAVYGRDAMEQLFFIPEEMMKSQNFLNWLQNQASREKPQQSYTNIVYFGLAQERSTLQTGVQQLYRTLNAISRVGADQIFNLNIDHLPKKTENPNPTGALNTAEDILHLYQTGNGRKAEDLIASLFRRWDKEQFTQLWMEHAAQDILLKIVSETGTPTQMDDEYALQDIFYSSTGIEDLSRSFSDMCASLCDRGNTKKTDSEETFQAVCQYLRSNIRSAPTLQSTADHFHISQAYLSKLFRNQTKQSYNQYLTALRMDIAKQLMRENPKLYVKDIAAMVGYSDQFYFSHVFHACTGKTPTEYLESINTAG